MSPLEPQRRRTAFVTGGTGCIGTNLVRELVREGWNTVVLHRPTSDLRHLTCLPVTLAEGDVTDHASLLRAIPEGADAVFHLAASLSFWAAKREEQHRINVDGTRNVLAAARARGVRRVVHTSSVVAYGEHDDLVTEDTPSNAEHTHVHYARTKWLGELEVRRAVESGLDAVIINPSNVVGPYDQRVWSRTFFLVQEGKLPALYPGRGSWCHVREVVRAEIAAVDRGRCGASYLLGGTHATYVEFIRTIGELLGKPVPTRVLSRGVLRAIAAVALIPSIVTSREPMITPEIAWYLCATTLYASERAERELGFRPVPLREMLEDAYRWLLGERLLPAPRAATVQVGH